MKKGTEVGVTSHSAFALATPEFYIGKNYLSTVFGRIWQNPDIAQGRAKKCRRILSEFLL